MLSYLIIQLFLAAVDEEQPWRPFYQYGGIILATYAVQGLLPGVIVGLRDPFPALGLVALTLTLIVTWTGLRLTPFRWFCDDTERLRKAHKQFRKILIVFYV